MGLLSTLQAKVKEEITNDRQTVAKHHQTGYSKYPAVHVGILKKLVLISAKERSCSGTDVKSRASRQKPSFFQVLFSGLLSDGAVPI